MEFSTPTKAAKSSELSEQEYTGCAFPLAFVESLTTDAAVLFSVAPGDTPLNFYMSMYDFCWVFFGRQKIVASYNVFIMINLFIIDCLTSIPTSEALPVDLYTKQRRPTKLGFSLVVVYWW